MNSESSKCMLCPRRCGVTRLANSLGFCQVGGEIKAARASLHMWEEPCISGKAGSGTVFFSGCPLRCAFCQNSEISAECNGKIIDKERLCEIFFELKALGALNINLVSPTPFIPRIADAIKLAKIRGFDLPFVFNSSGYELPETLKIMDGLIDIYLPDFKYMSPELAKKYSCAENYPEYAKSAIGEMVRQKPLPEFCDGIMKSGVIVRHLVLPGCTDDSKKIIKYLYDSFGNNIYISIMSQYTPFGKLDKFPELKRRLTSFEYNKVVDYAVDLGVKNGFIQDGKSALESFIPVFDNRGI